MKKVRALLMMLLIAAMCLFGCAVQPAEQSAQPEKPVQEEVQEEEELSEEASDDQAEREQQETWEEQEDLEEAAISEDGEYTTKEEVAEYIYTFGHLPSNFITKNEAKDLGWDSSKGNLSEVAPGKSIGGDRFGNREGNLPTKKGRKYTECDINADGGYRGAERIVFSNDGLIYYTGDHYNTFELLYGEE